MTAAQRSKAVKRRKEIWEALHPVKKGGKTVSTPGGTQQVGFASDTAASVGMTKQAINRHIARAEALGDDLDKVAGTSLLAKVSVRGLRKLQVRAPCVAGFTPFWGRTAAVAFLGEGEPGKVGLPSQSRVCPGAVPWDTALALSCRPSVLASVM